MASNPVPIRFPLGGISEDPAYATTPSVLSVRADHVLNVRPYDSIERRKRGGQRTGISKYFDDAINGSNPIQRISSFVEAFDASTIVVDEIIDDNGSGLTDDFTGQPADVPIQTHNASWSNFEGGYYFNAAATGGDGVGVFITHGAAAQGATSTNRSGAAYDAAANVGEAYIIKMDFQANDSAGFDFLGLVWRLAADPTDGDFHVLRINNQTTIQYLTYSGGTPTSVVSITVPAISTSTPHELQVKVNGNDFQFFLDAAQIGTTQTSSLHAGNSRVGFVSERATTLPNNNHARTFTVATGTVPASLRTTNLVAVSGGNFYVGTPSEGLSVPTGGTSTVKASGRVGVQEAFQDVFLCDGLSANYSYYDAATNQVKDWATDVTAGTLPQGTVDTTLGCRLMALYRGRIVLSGLEEDSQNWFMSASGDPFDWDYAPAVTSAIQAVAGNNSNVGVLGDIVTALIPFQDDLLFMGGDHTLWVMRGDPAAGGNIDNVSRQIGVAGPDAWTWDTGANLYFFGQNGLYRLAAGSNQPLLLSKGKMDRLFTDVDTAANNIRLLYDREWQGVHIFITPVNEPSSSTDHYWWDERTNTFWRDQYPTNIGPTAVHLFDADDPNDRAVLIGGFDSFIRKFDSTVNNDDGTLIDSFVRFPILHPSLPMGQFQMNDLQMHTDPNGNDVAFDIFRGATPEEAAVETTSSFTTTFVPGRNLPVRYRLRANAISYRLRNNTAGETWAYENGVAMIRGVGRQRAEL